MNRQAYSSVCLTVRVAAFALFVAGLLIGQTANAQNKKAVAPFTDSPTYVKWVASHHKAPFDRDGSVLPQGGAKALAKKQAEARAARAASTATTTAAFTNVQVTQDRNPWPKAEIAAAVDPNLPE